MSKQSISAKDLRNMITGFRKIVPRQSETLRELRIDLAQGTITGTNGSSFLSYQLGKAISDGRSYLLSFDALLHFAKGLPASQEILLEATDSVATLSTTERKCVAKPLRPDDPFATPAKFIGKTQTVTPEDRSAILRALTCASTDDTRYILRGVFLEHEGTTPQVVGTDGRCLYHERLQTLEIPKPFILPASPLLSWKGFEHEWQLKVSRSKKEPTMLQLNAGPWTLTTKAIDGNYPNWRQVVPALQSRPIRLTLGKSDLATLRDLKGESIGFRSKAGEKVSFVGFDKEVNKWNIHNAKDSTCQGNCQVFIDPKFLKRVLDTEVHEACIAEEFDPILFRGKGQLVVMPLRVTGPEIPAQKPQQQKPQPKTQTASPPPKPMPRTETNPTTTPAQAALESLRTLKGQMRESIGLVDAAIRQLRDVQADQRATQKDIKTIRGTLQSLKNVAFPN